VTLTPCQYMHNSGKEYLFFASIVVFLSMTGFSPALANCRSCPAQETQAKIGVSVDLVLLPVRVTDAHGTFISGLRLEDFRVFEDGRTQTLTVFEEDDTPVTVGFIVDHSRSMGSKLADVVAAVRSFSHLSNPQDEMFVVDFNDDVSVEPMKGKPFSGDAQDLEKALTAVSARGRTALYDAVSEGLHHLRLGHLDKKALVLISDGGDNASHLHYSQVLAEARQSQAAIYSIGLLGSSEEENPDVLRRLCKDTGGVAYFPHQGESVESVSKKIAQNLRAQYMIGYTPQNLRSSQRADVFRKVEVKVTAAGRGRVHVQTRPGYTRAPQKQPSAGLQPEAR
jgi:Ca-activated chloride channel family protein